MAGACVSDRPKDPQTFLPPADEVGGIQDEDARCQARHGDGWYYSPLAVPDQVDYVQRGAGAGAIFDPVTGKELFDWKATTVWDEAEITKLRQALYIARPETKAIANFPALLTQTVATGTTSSNLEGWLDLLTGTAGEPGTSPQDAANYAAGIINRFPQIPGLLPTGGQAAEMGEVAGWVGDAGVVDLETLIRGVFGRDGNHAEVARMIKSMTGVDISAAAGPSGPSREQTSASAYAAGLLASNPGLSEKTNQAELSALVYAAFDQGGDAAEVSQRIWDVYKVNVSEFLPPGSQTEDATAATEAVLNAHPELLTDYGNVTLESLTTAIGAALARGEGSQGIRDAVLGESGGKIDIYKAAPTLHTIALGDQDFQVGTETALDYALTQADLVDITIDGVTYKVPTVDALAWLKSDRNFTQMSAYEKGSLANSMARHNTMSAADIGNLAARNAELAESVRSSMVTEGQRAWEFGQEFPETVRQFDVTQAGLESRFARQLLEDQRQANIRAGTEQFGQLTGLIPQFGQLALQQTQQQAELLRNPADVGWGMATARGETPWWPQTTQADLLNQSAQQFADIQAFLADQAAGIYPPGAAPPVSTPLPQMPPPWSPPPIDEPPIDEPPIDEPPIDDEIPDPETEFDESPPPPRVITPGGPGSGWIQPDGAGADLEISDPERMFDDPFDPSQYGTPEAAAWARNRFDADTLRRLRDQGLSGFDAELPELQYGGQTRGTRALITGDSSFGRPNPELVLNPTGAPLKVIPMNQMSPRAARLAQFGRLPRAEHGYPHPTAQGYNALTGFNYTIPDFPVPPMFTQAGIVERKRAFLPPGPRDVLAGQRPAPLEFGFRMPTPGLMGSLTPNERAAFGSQLASEYNTSLGEVESGIRQRFGQTRRAPRARRARY